MENLSSILVQDDFGNPGSAIIVRGNKKQRLLLLVDLYSVALKTMLLLLIMYAIA